jgi:CRP/FNR family nitrogen fixation transcriptional regulator
MGLNARADAVLLATGPVRNVSQDQTIYSMSEPAEAILKVVSGVVRTCRFMSNGRRQIDAFHNQGDVFGFEAGPHYSLSAEAVSDCTLVSYQRSHLVSLAAHHQGFANQLYNHSLRNLARAHAHACLLGRLSALERLASFLADESTHSQYQEQVTLAMNRTDIADYLSLTVETVSRTLALLRKSQLIEFSSPRDIKIKNLNGLRMFAA